MAPGTTENVGGWNTSLHNSLVDNQDDQIKLNRRFPE